MNKKLKTNWWVDLILFVGFITTFFLNLTGVIAHQWIGIVIGAMALFHLILHSDWVNVVTERFFGKTSGKSRLYYVLDVLLLLGFSQIVFTGLIISTWMNLALSNYTGWLSFHIAISIGTLVTLLVKLALHWRWIASTTRKITTPQKLAPVVNHVASPAIASTKRIGRREFMQVMGVTGAASFLALANASSSLLENNISTVLAETGETTDAVATTETTEAVTVETIETEEAVAQATATTGSGFVVESVDEDTQTSSSSSSSTTLISPSTSSSTSSNCIVRCNRGCSYPGHCRRYTDSNNNGKCDLGECLS